MKEKSLLAICWMEKLIRLVSGLLAATVFLYSMYVLYDNFSINRNAFASNDLLQYKPSGRAEKDMGYLELKKINPDVIGWLTMDDTHIDYPVLQGKDDLEYSNKDVFGKFALSGSIYMAADCRKDFSDPYILIYGHHMDNGSMFGDIDRFADPAFLKKHGTGLMQTEYGNFDLHAFACMQTDAYDPMVYGLSGKDYASMAGYIREHASSYDEEAASLEGGLLVLSTCADSNTNGRMALFLKTTGHTGPVAGSTDRQLKRKASGHGRKNSSWAFLDLVCAMMAVYTFFPLGCLRRKYGQILYAVKLRRLSGDPKLVRDLGRFLVFLFTGMIIEGVVAAGSSAWFYMNENIVGPVTVLGHDTPLMIGLFGLVLCMDYICFRYRGIRPETNELSDNNVT